MNKVYLQIWEESERGWGVRPDGCSIHLTLSNRNEYVSEIYGGRRLGNVPDEYERVVGNPLSVFISDEVLKETNIKGYLRLMEHEFRNLISMEEIVYPKNNSLHVETNR